jgi:hypothetical protein
VTVKWKVFLFCQLFDSPFSGVGKRHEFKATKQALRMERKTRDEENCLAPIRVDRFRVHENIFMFYVMDLA